MAFFPGTSRGRLAFLVTVAALVLECACQFHSERRVAAGQAASTVGWREVWPHLDAIWTTDDSRVWVVGEGGAIFHSGDGGLSWTNQPTNTANALNGIFGASDEKSLWVVGAHESFFRPETPELTGKPSNRPLGPH